MVGWRPLMPPIAGAGRSALEPGARQGGQRVPVFTGRVDSMPRDRRFFAARHYPPGWVVLGEGW